MTDDRVGGDLQHLVADDPTSSLALCQLVGKSSDADLLRDDAPAALASMGECVASMKCTRQGLE